MYNISIGSIQLQMNLAMYTITITYFIRTICKMVSYDNNNGISVIDMKP